MHELAVTQELLGLVLEHSTRAGGGRVTDVHVLSGEICGFVDDSVRFYWDALSEGTAAAGALLHFQRVPLEFECSACGSRFVPAGGTYDCSGCGSARVRVVSGREFRLEAIDIEDPPATGEAPVGPGSEEREER
jgi:hydrogenase nickel incorporation protein HypA/HybF